MPPQRELGFRVRYRFEGNVAHCRLAIAASTPASRVEEALRKAAAYHETSLQSRFSDVELLDYDPI